MVVVTIPARNEECSVAEVVRGARGAVEGAGHECVVHVVDDASSDATAARAVAAGARVFPSSERAGLAGTFRREMTCALETDADWIVHLDADGQYVPQDIPALLGALAEGADLVLGSRFRGEIEGMPARNRIGNRVLTGLVRTVTRRPISDAQSGLRAFTRDVARLPIRGAFTYTQSQLISAARAGFEIHEVPIRFRPRAHGSSRLISSRPVAGVRMLLDLARSAWA
jgi:glycosyltransferase involved in cell wall biosynthesis